LAEAAHVPVETDAVPLGALQDVGHDDLRERPRPVREGARPRQYVLDRRGHHVPVARVTALSQVVQRDRDDAKDAREVVAALRRVVGQSREHAFLEERRPSEHEREGDELLVVAHGRVVVTA